MEKNESSVVSNTAARLLQIEKAVRSLTGDGGGSTSGGMDDVWKKLEEHDRSLARIELDVAGVKSDIAGLKTAVSHLPTQIQLVWGAIIFAIALAGIVYAVGSYMSTTMATALVAIQTVIAERPPASPVAPPPPAPQPNIIILPMPTLQPAAPPPPR